MVILTPELIYTGSSSERDFKKHLRSMKSWFLRGRDGERDTGETRTAKKRRPKLDHRENTKNRSVFSKRGETHLIYKHTVQTVAALQLVGLVSLSCAHIVS